MCHILIPTDFSKNSLNAIAYGLSFFKQTHSKIFLLHIAPLELVSGLAVENRDNDRYLPASVSNQFKSLQEQIENLPYYNDFEFKTIYQDAFFIEAIRKQIQKSHIDYIIMGTKGASGLRDKIIGTNTGNVITKVKCPVLLIPERANYQEPKEIAFPTDFNIIYKDKVLTTISDILEMTKASLRILHITKDRSVRTYIQENNKKSLDHFLGEKRAHSFHFLSGRNINASIQSFVKYKNIDMIIMIGKNLNFFQQMLFKPIIEQISYQTSVPFLVLHE